MKTRTPFVMLSDGCRGGAHTAAIRLKTAMTSAGTAIRWLVAEPSDGGTEAAARWPALAPYVAYRVAYYGIKSERRREHFRRYVLEQTLARRLHALRPDIVNLHNLHGNLTSSMLRGIPESAAVIWTAHDMWPFTGGCCYSAGCLKFQDGCAGDCQQKEMPGGLIRPPDAEWRLRQDYFKTNAKRIAIISPSEWLAGVARRRLGPNIRVACIPNSLDTERFYPLRDRQIARRALDLPEKGAILLAGAHWTEDPRKGMKYLREAVRLLQGDGARCFTVVVFGENTATTHETDGWLFRGLVHDERLMNLYYNAADVYVLPSLADNLPNMLVESQAAGTPGVAFDVGGCGEIIEHGVTGMIVAPRDSVALAAALRNMLALRDDEKALWSLRCREHAVAHYNPARQAMRYQALCEEMLVERARTR